MNENLFTKKFESKSDLELESIAIGSKSFVFDARYAAARLLKSRDFQSPIIQSIEEEALQIGYIQQKKLDESSMQDENLIKELRKIPIKETGKYRLKNGNQLQVKRLNQKNFQVRIEADYRSALAPVMICNIRDNASYLCYPFLYLKPILIYGLGGVGLIIILSWLGYVKMDTLVFSMPLIAIIGMQLILMPIMFFTILKFFKERLRKVK